MRLISCLIATTITTLACISKGTSWHCSYFWCAVRKLNMKCKHLIFNFTCGKNLLTRQRALFKSKRRGDSRCAIATRFTCQRSLCNRGKRQGDMEIAHVLSLLASLASEPYAIEENGKEMASVLSPLASLASEPYVIEENGKEIANVLSTRTLFTGLAHIQRCKIVFNSERNNRNLMRNY